MNEYSEPRVAGYAVDSALARLVECIGTRAFEAVFERILRSLCGAVQFASYRASRARLARVAGALNEADAVGAIAGFGAFAPERLCIGEKSVVVTEEKGATVCGHRAGSVIWLIVRCDSGGFLRGRALEAFSRTSDLFLTAHAKHAEMLDARESATRALASIDHIEECLAASNALTTREIEVCARIIYGISTLGIAIDLFLGEETVRTYRKRAYQRLGLGTERQLLTWYLRQWTHWQHGRG